jgi:hypothetical protein
MESIQIVSQAWYEDRTDRWSVREVGALLRDDACVGGAVGAQIKQGLAAEDSVQCPVNKEDRHIDLESSGLDQWEVVDLFDGVGALGRFVALDDAGVDVGAWRVEEALPCAGPSGQVAGVKQAAGERGSSAAGYEFPAMLSAAEMFILWVKPVRMTASTSRKRDASIMLMMLPPE